MKAIKTASSQFYYLRNLDAFVFEEMVLTSLKRKGYIIVRNEGYTGDGGIDGRAYLNGEHYLIQSKRYSGSIHSKDVEELGVICRRRKGKGLFVHTGKTGATARELASKHGVIIISGTKLLELLLTPVPEEVIELSKIANACFKAS